MEGPDLMKVGERVGAEVGPKILTVKHPNRLNICGLFFNKK
jgi:hypothetical protein